MKALRHYVYAAWLMSGLTLAIGRPAVSASAQTFDWTDGDILTNDYTAAGNWGKFFTDANPTPNTFDETARFGRSTSNNQTVNFNASNVNVDKVLIEGADPFNFTGGGRLTVDDGIFSTATAAQTFNNPISTRSTANGSTVFSNRRPPNNASGALIFSGAVTVNQSLRLDPHPEGGLIEFRGPVNGNGDVFLEPGAAPAQGRVVFRASNTFDDLGIVGQTRVELRGGGRLGGGADVSIGNQGTLALYGMADAINGLNGGGTVELNDGASLVIGNYAGFGSVGTGAFDGLITGNGSLVKRGSGGLFVLLDSNAHTGGTLVEEGVLQVDGLSNGAGAGPTTVFAGARLQGVGALANTATVRSGGRVSPGADGTTGTLTFENLNLEVGSNLSIDIEGSEQPLQDLVRVAGDATLGGVLTVFASGLIAQTPGRYTVLEADGTLTGSFEIVELLLSSPGTLAVDVLYDANRVDVVITDPSAALAGDFDNDGDVDGSDFLRWQRNASVGDLAAWEADYGTTTPPPAMATVPEPKSLLLPIGASVLCCCPRRAVTR